VRLPADSAPQSGDLESLRAAVEACRACGLCQTRSRTVFADGSSRARVMFVGEAPGAREDATGLPFVGDAGQLLTRIIESGMGLTREAVYIANVLKCRPPDNRDPSPEEKQLCAPFLERQIELVNPAVLIALGRHAANQLLGTDLPLSALRGRVHQRGERQVVVTYHPAYLLRTPSAKKDCWQDIQQAMALLGLKPKGPGAEGSPS
jgi:DNA polymerase